MEELIKKTQGHTITTSYSAPMTEELKQGLVEIRDVEGVDVNEHFRQFAKALIDRTFEEKNRPSN